MREIFKILLSIIIGIILLCALVMLVVWLCNTGIILYLLYFVFGLCAIAMAIILIYGIYLFIDEFYD